MPIAVNRSQLCLGLVLVASGCHRSTPAATKPTPPATVTAAVKEDQLTTVVLTEAAENRLGIKTATVEMREIPQYRTFAGEVTPPTGAIIIVTAPFTGKVQAPTDRKVPMPGTAVVEKQPVLALLPVLAPNEKIALLTQLADADGLVQQAKSLVESNRIELDRQESLANKSVGSAKAVDDAKAKMQLSVKALEAAQSRKKVLEAARLDGEKNIEGKPIVFEAPESGILRTLLALPEQTVVAGAPLFEVMRTDMIWIRVPVYVGESSEIATDQPAEIGGLAWRPGQDLVKAVPIAAPPTATALSSTVDLYYQLPNSKGTLRPGQRVSVQLPLVGRAEQRVIPWSAVVQDIYGGQWVYERRDERKFVRLRVQVKRVVDSWAILDQGPPVGTTIVTTGVAEIFGTEFWKQ